MYKLNLKNATLKTILSWRRFSISKMEFKEGYQEQHSYTNRRRLFLIPTAILSKKKCSINWTSFFGKEKKRTFNYCGGIMLSW